MDIFKAFIKTLAPSLKQMGLNKKGNGFYLISGKNYGIINFQKSRESTKEVILFTINFGIFSDVLGRLQYNYSDSIKPEVEQCHWQARIGSFMPGSPDYWWKANVSDNLSGVVSSVLEIVESVILPEIMKRLDDEGLIRSWMDDGYMGTTEIGRFKCLTTLLKAKSDIHNLNQVVETFMKQFKGKPNVSIAMEHLKEIEYFK